ncbi:low affinity iron permease family protein [Flavobacterium sp.]|uniref:low affinity iron permease family protein n=1 Tax=Flavobacterium sp. TaxID=239 RepID=UPI0026340C70|nr:low affinity iron permease family protein [Flavobacterium sp.]
MKIIYRHAETGFEKLVSIATTVLGNSITFMFAVIMVAFWWINSISFSTDIHEVIGDIIFGSTFLCLFIIQKSFNKFSAALHVKINELVSANENARNAVMNLEVKTEHEINELTKEYIDLAEQHEEENSDTAKP